MQYINSNWWLSKHYTSYNANTNLRKTAQNYLTLTYCAGLLFDRTEIIY